ncbi:MAG: HNH endonuclease signature motif containing protein [Candidatus Latescibacterota bacterium]|jgi:hypothetical protein
MPRDKNLRKKKYDLLVHRDGERCQICGRVPPEVYLEVDHKDGDETNDADENLWLLCRSDHRKKHPRGKNKKGEHIVTKRVVSVDNYKEIVDQSRMSPEMYQNKKAEPAFRHWLYNKMKENGVLSVAQIIASGAEKAGCSTYAVRTNYLVKCISDEGLYCRYYDEDRKMWMVAFRNAAAIGVMTEAIDFEDVNDTKH